MIRTIILVLNLHFFQTLLRSKSAYYEVTAVKKTNSEEIIISLKTKCLKITLFTTAHVRNKILKLLGQDKITLLTACKGIGHRL